MVNNDTAINVKLPEPLKKRFAKALEKRMQNQSRVLRAAIERYCEEADRMGTPKRIK
jgi:metal-responsive CopG/Arc/MetJ family transcriptional regulator